jgi:hypothetical protein
VHARGCLGDFRVRYNRFRPHWALRPEEGGDPLVPEEAYAGSCGAATAMAAVREAAKEKLNEMMGAA